MKRCIERSSERCSAKQVLSQSPKKINGIMKANVNSLKILANIPILNKKKTNKKKINK